MAAVFRLFRDGKRPLTVRLDADAVVGRGHTAGLRIDSRKVSREHCRLTIDEDVVTVRDLGSRNGTAVDGEALEKGQELDVPVGATLSVGGIALRLIRCGEVTVNVEQTAPVAPPASPTAEEPAPPPAEEPDAEDQPSAAKPTPEPPATQEADETPSAPDDPADEAVDASAVTLPAVAGETDAEEDVDPNALGFLGDDDGDAGDDASALKVLPEADARDQSSFTGFGEPGDDAVDSGLLDFLKNGR